MASLTDSVLKDFADTPSFSKLSQKYIKEVNTYLKKYKTPKAASADSSYVDVMKKLKHLQELRKAGTIRPTSTLCLRSTWRRDALAHKRNS